MVSPTKTIEALLLEEEIHPDEYSSIRVIDLDSLLVEELMALIDRSVGYQVEVSAFTTSDATLADVIAFVCERAS